MKIHLLEQFDNKALCGKIGLGTHERQPNPKFWNKICKDCIAIYLHQSSILKSRTKESIAIQFNNFMEKLATWDESDSARFYTIPYLLLAFCTCGISIPILAISKYFAKLYIKL